MRTQGKGSSAHEEKVNKLFAIMSRWDSSAQQLPSVVARLQSLREMHEESADATLRLSVSCTRPDPASRLQMS